MTDRLNRLVTFTIGLTTKEGQILLPTDVIEKSVAPALRGWKIDGFTVTHTSGYWKGAAESSIKVEIVLPDTDPAVRSAPGIASYLAELCNQECVLWTVTTCDAGFGES